MSTKFFFFWYQNGEKKCIAFGRSLTQGFRGKKKINSQYFQHINCLAIMPTHLGEDDGEEKEV